MLQNVLSQEDFPTPWGRYLSFRLSQSYLPTAVSVRHCFVIRIQRSEDYSTVFGLIPVSVAIYLVLLARVGADSPYISRRRAPDSSLKGDVPPLLCAQRAGHSPDQSLDEADGRKDACHIQCCRGDCRGWAWNWIGVRGIRRAWALVWQSVTIAGIKTAILWATGRCLPVCRIKIESLRKIWRIGLSVFPYIIDAQHGLFSTSIHSLQVRHIRCVLLECIPRPTNGAKWVVLRFHWY